MPEDPNTVIRPSTHRPDVQALRGLAVLLVVIYHAWPRALPGGYVGVDVFFVISGYLITGLLLREIESSGRINFAAFYARRIRRLLPAASLVIATTTIAVALLQSPLEVAEFSSSAIAAASYVGNMWFAVLSVDYLQEGVRRNLLLHTWSLGVEEQFYLLWPALIAGATALLRRVDARRAIGWMVAVVTLLSLIACLWLTAAEPNWAFFSLPTRAWELGIGAAASLLQGRIRSLDGTARRTMVVTGLVSILASAFAFSNETWFPGHAAILPVVGAFLVVLGGTPDGGGSPFGLQRLEWMQRLGDVSYSWYLWHWPVLILFVEAWPASDRGLVAFAGAAASLALARLTYEFVENPVREHPMLKARPARTMALGLMLTVGTVAIAAASRLAVTRGHEADMRRRIEQAARDRPRLYDDKCFASALDTEPPACIYGAAAGARTVVLLGDSHAAQWFPAVEKLALANGWRLAVFVKAACPLAMVEPYDGKLNRPYRECTQWREKVFERLATMRPALVFAGNASHYEPFVARNREAQKQWQDGLELSLRRLVGLAGHVVVLRDTPLPGFHVPRCLARTHPRGGEPSALCNYLLTESVLPSAFEVERAAVQGNVRATVVDMTDMLCTTAMCPVEKDGMVVFHDSQHLSATFARSLAEALWLRLPPAARAELFE